MQGLVSHPVNGRCSVITSICYGYEICETVLNCDIIWCPHPHIKKDNMGHRGETCKSDYNLEVDSFRLLFSFFHMPVYRPLWIRRSPGKGCPKHLNARVDEGVLQRSEQFLRVLAFTCLIL